MANGLPGYSVERREEFFKVDWPIVKTTCDLVLTHFPAGAVPTDPQKTALMIVKMTQIISIFSQIIEDDQAEILALKTIMKAMEKKDGPTV